MKKTILLLAVSACLSACTGKSNQSNNDSVEYSVFAAYPLDAVEDLDPVYIKTEDVDNYEIGDTVTVNNEDFISDTGKNIHKSVLQEKLNYTKRFKK